MEIRINCWPNGFGRDYKYRKIDKKILYYHLLSKKVTWPVNIFLNCMEEKYHIKFYFSLKKGIIIMKIIVKGIHKANIDDLSMGYLSI